VKTVAQTMKCCVSRTDSVLDLKVKLALKTSVPVAEQGLYIGHTALPDNACLAKICNKGQAIKLVRLVVVRTNSGHFLTLEVDPGRLRSSPRPQMDQPRSEVTTAGLLGDSAVEDMDDDDMPRCTNYIDGDVHFTNSGTMNFVSIFTVLMLHYI
jgi:hypothetical protein